MFWRCSAHYYNILKIIIIIININIYIYIYIYFGELHLKGTKQHFCKCRQNIHVRFNRSLCAEPLGALQNNKIWAIPYWFLTDSVWDLVVGPSGRDSNSGRVFDRRRSAVCRPIPRGCTWEGLVRRKWICWGLGEFYKYTFVSLVFSFWRYGDKVTNPNDQHMPAAL